MTHPPRARSRIAARSRCRIARACREAGIESVAVYSEADARRHARDRRRPRREHRRRATQLPLDRRRSSTRRSTVGRRRAASGLRLPLGTGRVRARLRRGGPRLRRAAGRRHRADGIEDRRARADGSAPACRSCPATRPRIRPTRAFAQAARRLGFPVLVKASAGGGGKGMRAVRARTRKRSSSIGAGAARGAGRVRRRHALRRAADRAAAPRRDPDLRRCARQRRCTSSSASARSSAGTRRSSRKARRPALTPGDARSAWVRPRWRRRAPSGIGTPARSSSCVEGTGDDARFYFLEMNTRLQVEHPVTEAVTGVDLVRAQLAVAAGEPLPWTQDELSQRGHAIECRIYAEDPANGFLPQAGPLLLYREPSGPGIRVDSGVREGDRVGVDYDPLLAKLIVFAETREAATARAVTALRAYPDPRHPQQRSVPDPAARPSFVCRRRPAHGTGGRAPARPCGQRRRASRSIRRGGRGGHAVGAAGRRRRGGIRTRRSVGDAGAMGARRPMTRCR